MVNIPDDTIVEKCAIFCIDPISRESTLDIIKKKVVPWSVYTLAKSYLVKRAQACEEQITI